MKNYILIILIFIFLNSCSMFNNHSINIITIKPAKLNLGIKPKVSIIETKGSLRTLEEGFVDFLIRKANAKGFDFTNRIPEGIKIEIQNYKPFITNNYKKFDYNEFFLVVDFVDKEDVEIVKKESRKIFKKIEKVEKGEKKGKPEQDENNESSVKEYYEPVDVVYKKTEIVIQLTLANSENLVLNREEFKESYEWKPGTEPIEKNQRYLKLLENIAFNFINDITPQYETKTTAFDNTDKNQEFIINLIKEKKYEQATEELKKYLIKNPESASAYFNLAVLYDFKRDYENAMENYNEACRRDYQYDKVRKQCEIRIRYNEALKL